MQGSLFALALVQKSFLGVCFAAATDELSGKTPGAFLSHELVLILSSSGNCGKSEFGRRESQGLLSCLIALAGR